MLFQFKEDGNEPMKKNGLFGWFKQLASFKEDFPFQDKKYKNKLKTIKIIQIILKKKLYY